ncbi:hypothetical protein Lal_00026802, partial [Lupinus albus]
EPSKYVLRMRHANLFEEEPLLDELMQLADSSLITVVVERWRPETHTFHLPCGECTITLEDVSLQLGVNVTGRPLIEPTYFDWDEMCGELLGKVSIVEEDMRGCELKLAWLSTPPNPTQIQLQHYCRTHILYIILGELLSDKSNSRIHLMYLHLLRDLSRVHRYSWGSTCLANLYRELCRATKPNAKAMGGCLMLLQSWAWYRLPFLAPRMDGLPTYPFAKRWGQTQLIFQGVPRGDLTKLYQTDRVRLQFGLVQDIPQEPKNLDALHRVDKRGNQDANWATKHAQWIEYWSQRRD